MANIPFTSNYTDLSIERGYQFQFFCRKCGNGYMSTFQANSLSGIASAANVAASIRRNLRPGCPVGCRHPESGRRPTARFGARRGGARDQPDLQAVHPVRELGLRAGVLEQEGGPVRDVRAGHGRGDRGRAGAGRSRTSGRQGAHRRLPRAAQPRAGRLGAVPELRCQDAGWQVLSGVRHEPRPKRTCATCGAEADGSPKFCPECGKPYGS